MPVLIGIALGCALLYFWLAGHWFARILTFICAAGFLGYFGLIFIPPGSNGAIALLIDFALALGVSWLLSGIPTWYWRRRVTEL